MSRKYNIINGLVTQLKKIDGSEHIDSRYKRSPYTFQSNVYNNVYDKFKYIDEINDFPTICIYSGSENRIHIGGGVKFGILETNIRGYVRGEDPNEFADKLIDDIEYLIDGFSYEECDESIVDARVLQVETDEGLFAPLGVCELTVQISYEVKSLV